MSSFPVNYERRVLNANQSGKIFRMSESYAAPRVREALEKRGYIEQKAVPYNSVYFKVNCAMQFSTEKEFKEYQQVVIYRLAKRVIPWIFLAE